MIIRSLGFVFILLLSLQSGPAIKGNWKLVSYDAIEKIRLSPAYAYGDKDAREHIEKQFQLILSKGEYHFSDSVLNYTDIDGSEIIFRRAMYSLKKDTLLIEEIDRSFKRKAYVKFLSSDSLVLSPIIDNKISDSKLVFTRR